MTKRKKKAAPRRSKRRGSVRGWLANPSEAEQLAMFGDEGRAKQVARPRFGGGPARSASAGGIRSGGGGGSRLSRTSAFVPRASSRPLWTPDEKPLWTPPGGDRSAEPSRAKVGLRGHGRARARRGGRPFGGSARAGARPQAAAPAARKTAAKAATTAKVKATKAAKAATTAAVAAKSAATPKTAKKRATKARAAAKTAVAAANVAIVAAKKAKTAPAKKAAVTAKKAATKAVAAATSATKAAAGHYPYPDGNGFLDVPGSRKKKKGAKRGTGLRTPGGITLDALLKERDAKKKKPAKKSAKKSSGGKRKKAAPSTALAKTSSTGVRRVTKRARKLTKKPKGWGVLPVRGILFAPKGARTMRNPSVPTVLKESAKVIGGATAGAAASYAMGQASQKIDNPYLQLAALAIGGMAGIGASMAIGLPAAATAVGMLTGSQLFGIGQNIMAQRKLASGGVAGVLRRPGVSGVMSRPVGDLPSEINREDERRQRELYGSDGRVAGLFQNQIAMRARG
jgi:hypothetical protein